jgi:hypothetical protein
MDGFFSASPFSSMRRFDELMDQQFQQVDPFGGSSLRNMRSFEDSMQQQFREMDRQFDRAFADMDRAQQKMDAEIERSLRQLQEQQPGVRIERREESAPGAYRCGQGMPVTEHGRLAAMSGHTCCWQSLCALPGICLIACQPVHCGRRCAFEPAALSVVARDRG